MWLKYLLRRLLVFLITLLVVGFLGATLVRLAPGFGVDARQLDSRLREESIETMRNDALKERDILRYYARYVSQLARGNLGYSRTLARPVAELFAERFPITFRTVAFGLLGGWALALTAAAFLAFSQSMIVDLVFSGVSGLFLSLPSAIVALFFLFSGGPVAAAVALVVFPKVFLYTRNLLIEGYAKPHILAARARGLAEGRIFYWHVVPSAAPQILALAGVSVSLAFGASIPIEVVCDSPGLGQLAWQAALGRDLPLLVALTLVVTAVTLLANAASDLVIEAAETAR
ncbi:MAG: ABC transporter permease [Acidobacteriota bacterium]|nr:ABC transporter permease [Acidobacteriota bacterium]